jgi:membrane-associated protein
LGTHPWVKEHFELVVFGIIGISLLPIIVGYIRGKLSRS